jgi:ThiF family
MGKIATLTGRHTDAPRVVVCGVGALGGSLIEHLARSAFPAWLVAIDHDRVEAANVGNQPYDVRQAGMSKVHALAARVYEGCGCEIEGIHATLDAKSAPKLLRGADLVVDALDGAAGRLVVRDACSALGVTALHAGLGPNGYVDVRRNEGYRIAEPYGGTGPCREATTRSQVLLCVVLTAEAIRGALAGEAMANRATALAALLDSASMP